jgi:hypothetical protein
VVKSSMFLIAFALSTGCATAMPFDRAPASEHSNLVKVAIICEPDGRCYELPRRPPVARWVYGSDAFYGPGYYTGPRYYGRPGTHWGWWGFLRY